jgi:hypothetical protein
MKATDVINRLRQVIPRHTSLFCDELNVTSLTCVNGVVTCVCATKHNLKIGVDVFISGALTPITIESINRDGNLALATTMSNHDLTLGWQETITLNGAVQNAYNGAHKLKGVPNRRSFIFEVSGNPITPATGDIKMIEDITHGYNGLHIVDSIIDDYSFTFKIKSAPESPALGSVKLRKEISITGDVTMERFFDSYSKQNPNKFYMVVIMGGASASKDRFTMSDAISTSTAAVNDSRIRVIDPFSIFVVAPASEYLTAMTIRDGMEAVFSAINKSILFYKFPSDSSMQSVTGVAFESHSMYAYDVARYVHEFRYQSVYDLSKDDGAYDDESVAFRDIDLHFNSYLNSKNNELMHTLVDLDEQPLP